MVERDAVVDITKAQSSSPKYVIKNNFFFCFVFKNRLLPLFSVPSAPLFQLSPQNREITKNETFRFVLGCVAGGRGRGGASENY